MISDMQVSFCRLNLQRQQNITNAHGSENARDSARTSTALHILRYLSQDDRASCDAKKRRDLGEVELRDNIELDHCSGYGGSKEPALKLAPSSFSSTFFTL